MRLKNVKNKDIIIESNKNIIKNKNELKNKWNKEFKNNNPIEIEIGMGKGNFLINKAKDNKNINYIGIEKYASVIVRAIQKIENIPNLKLLNMDALELENVFGKEINKIYLNFSDPWPKRRHQERRLTSPRFLKIYENISKNMTHIEMKTDNRELFDYSLKQFKKFNYNIIIIDENYGINKNNIYKTEYEEKFISMGKNIYYIEVKK